MGSRRSLLALSLLAAALAVLVTLGGSQPSGSVDTRVLPELRVAEISELRWSGAGGALVLRRGPAGWAVAGSDSEGAEFAPASDAAVDRVLGALEFLRFERRAAQAPGQADGEAATLVVIAGGGLELRLDVPPVEAEGRAAWIARDESWFLVSAATARLLHPALDELRDDAVFSFESIGVTSVDIGHPGELIVVDGPPWRVRADGVPGALRADDGAVASFLDRLLGLRAARFVGPGAAVRPAPNQDSRDVELRVRVRSAAGEQLLEVVGACAETPEGPEGPEYKDLRRARTRLGAVCLPAAAIAGLVQAAPSAAALVDRRPAAVDPGRVSFIDVALPAGAHRLERRGATWAIRSATETSEVSSAPPVPGEPGAVEAALAQLAEPLGDFAVPGAATRSLATVRIAVDGAETALELFEVGATRYVRRVGEAVAYAVPAGYAGDLLDAVRLRSRQVVELEPTLVRAVEWRRRGRRLLRVERGELVGEWRPASGAPVDASTAVKAIARLRALSIVGVGIGVGGPPAGALEVAVELDAVPGQTASPTVRLALWSADDGCRGSRLDVDQPLVFIAPPSACEAMQPPR